MNVRKPVIYFQSLLRFMGFGGSSQHSGEQLSGPIFPAAETPLDVSEDVALMLSSVFGACRIIVETVAGMGMYPYLKRGGEWVDDETDELYMLLQVQPNPYMTHIEFWESVIFNLVLRGNGYALIMRNSIGMPIGLYPLAAAQMQPIVLSDGTGWYIHTMDGIQTMHAAEDILHFRLFGNGRVGLSPLQYGALAMGIAGASDRYAGTFFQRGGKPGGVLTIDRILTPKQREDMRAVFKEVHEGVDSAHKLFVLEAGMKYEQVQLDPEQVQMIATRQFGVRDVARFFGVPAFLLNESEGSTSWGTGLEQQMLGFYNLTIRPYTMRIAAHCRMKLIPVAQQRRRKLAYDFDELLAVGLQAKAEYYSKLVANGIMTRAEVRTRLALPKHDDPAAGDLTAQSAMVPIQMLGKVPAGKVNEGTQNAGTQEPNPPAA